MGLSDVKQHLDIRNIVVATVIGFIVLYLFATIFNQPVVIGPLKIAFTLLFVTIATIIALNVSQALGTGTTVLTSGPVIAALIIAAIIGIVGIYLIPKLIPATASIMAIYG